MISWNAHICWLNGSNPRFNLLIGKRDAESKLNYLYFADFKGIQTSIIFDRKNYYRVLFTALLVNFIPSLFVPFQASFQPFFAIFGFIKIANL